MRTAHTEVDGLEPRCVVRAARPSACARAAVVAKRLALPLLTSAETTAAGVALVVDDTTAWLQALGAGAPGPIAIDFASPTMMHRRKGGQNELLGRAIGIKQQHRPSVVDATAGLGRDSFVLADLGCRVTLIERHPALAWLLAQAVEAGLISAVAQVRDAAQRMTVQPGDCTQATVPPGAVIYLDPMFEDRKSSAAVKKDLHVLRVLHGPDGTADSALIQWAWAQPCSRIVVKRAGKAPPLTETAPSHQLLGKAIRFDVYVRHSAVSVVA